MKRSTGWYVYTIRKGTPGKNPVTVSLLLVPPLPEALRNIMVRNLLEQNEVVTFVAEADKVLLHEDQYTKFQVLTFD